MTPPPPTHPILWPIGTRLFVYDRAKLLVDKSRNRKYDLNDNLFQAWSDRLIYLEVEVHNELWKLWDSKALTWIERRIRWDLRFDGNEFNLRRHTRRRGYPCAEGFLWMIHVHP